MTTGINVGINVEKVRQITFTCNSYAWSLNNIGLKKLSIPESIVVDKMPQGIINEDFLTNSVYTSLNSGFKFLFLFQKTR